MMMPAQQEFTVFVVDDEERVRRSVVNMLASFGMHATAFDSTAAYLNAERPDMPACLVLDVQLPEVSGLEFQETIAAEEHPPIIFISGHGAGHQAWRGGFSHQAAACRNASGIHSYGN